MLKRDKPVSGNVRPALERAEELEELSMSERKPHKSISDILGGDSRAISAENRVFNVFALMSALLSVLLIISNIIIRIPLSHLALSISVAVVSACVYFISRNTKKFVLLSSVYSAMLLCLILMEWFVDNGTMGSSGYFIAVALVGFGIYMVGIRKTVFLAVLAALMAVLFYVEGRFPGMISSTHNSRMQRLLDVSVCYMICFVFVILLVDMIMSHLQRDRQELTKATEEIRVLRGILPLCPSCKKIRDDKGYWDKLEKYFLEHTSINFSHGLCPDCVKQLYGQDFLPDEELETKRVSTNTSKYFSSVASVLLGSPETTTVENRVFNLVMFLIVMFGVLITVSDVVLKLPWIQNIISLAAVVVGFLFYISSLRKKNYESLSLPASCFFVAVLAVGWFCDDGTRGSVGYFFILLAVASVMYLRGRTKAILLGSMAAVIIALVMTEVLFPRAIAVSHVNRIHRLWDVSSCIFITFSVIGLMIHLVLKQQKDDREKLARALEEIRELHGILPMCAHCKKIRDDNGYWNKVEIYFKDHAGMEFSHGLCPECLKKHGIENLSY
jgi:MFS family permease